jgi:hypothetical protein
MCHQRVMMHQIMSTLPTTVAGSEALYLTVRATLVTRGSSLNAWCKAQRLNRQTVEKALRGQREGRRALALRERIVREVLETAA